LLVSIGKKLKKLSLNEFDSTIKWADIVSKVEVILKNYDCESLLATIKDPENGSYTRTILYNNQNKSSPFSIVGLKFRLDTSSGIKQFALLIHFYQTIKNPNKRTNFVSVNPLQSKTFEKTISTPIHSHTSSCVSFVYSLNKELKLEENLFKQIEEPSENVALVSCVKRPVNSKTFDSYDPNTNFIHQIVVHNNVLLSKNHISIKRDSALV
jgi:hypothetical protein